MARKTINGVTYDADTDYMGLMEEAAASGDFAAAANFEKQRNAKIDGERIKNYDKTNIYGGYTNSASYGQDVNYVKDQLINYEPFSYDPEDDELYGSYRKQYLREGQRATEDTLGQYAAMTGGLPSTAAVNAASQAGDYYNAKLGDAIPELRQLAYSMYMDDKNNLMNQLSAFQGLQAGAESSEQWDRQFEYNAAQNEMSRKQQETEQAQNLVIYLIENGGAPSAALIEKSGLTKQEIATLQANR